MGNENTHVANATSKEILVFFESRKLHLQEIAIDATTEAGVSVAESVEGHLNAGAAIKVVLKPDSRIQFLRCPSREYIKIPLQGSIYVTVISGDSLLIAMNFLIPSDRSIIALDRMIKMTKYGFLWQDEDGKYH